MIPVIVVSARDAHANRERAIKAGAKAFLQKPVDDAELLATIRKALGEPEHLKKPDDDSVPRQRKSILTEALRQPELSPRELAFYISDHVGFAVSESSVYRILKRTAWCARSGCAGVPRCPVLAPV